MKIEIEKLLETAKEAGRVILEIYKDPTLSRNVSYKADDSPLTLADQASNEVIVKSLQTLYPEIPVLSEEGQEIPFRERSNWDYFWCVDPLDGTKEFVKRNGEFTVNIALIHRRRPILGIIYIPVSGVMYYAGQNLGAWKIDTNGLKTRLSVTRPATEWTALGSRTHSSAVEAEILAKYPVTKTIAIGSSIKFCLMAEGLAQIYYRQGPTMEWDTAAGHAILFFSGGNLTTPEGGEFLYNKEQLLNGSFLCTVCN